MATILEKHKAKMHLSFDRADEGMQSTEMLSRRHKVLLHFGRLNERTCAVKQEQL